MLLVHLVNSAMHNCLIWHFLDSVPEYVFFPFNLHPLPLVVAIDMSVFRQSSSTLGMEIATS